MKINWEYILQNKFNYLLMTQIIILIAYPIFHSTQAVFPIMPLLLLIAITPALWVGLSRKIFLSVISVGGLAFIFNVIAAYAIEDLAKGGILVLLFLYALFYFLAILILITKISSKTTITTDTIKGGISIYILLGFFWAVLYMILVTFDNGAISIPDPINNDSAIICEICENSISSPNSISFTSATNEGDGTYASKPTSFDCYYYSFTTLTTLGYGDIAPVTKYARILAILESVTGPVYLAIFVAQIIGMNIAQKMKS